MYKFEQSNTSNSQTNQIQNNIKRINELYNKITKLQEGKVDLHDYETQIKVFVKNQVNMLGKVATIDSRMQTIEHFIDRYLPITI